jgi:YD repeat-containing protein
LNPADPSTWVKTTNTSTLTFDADWATAYEYDGRNNLVTKTEGLATGSHAITRYDYDAANRLTRVHRPDGTQRDYMYDALTRRVAQP